VTDYDDPVDLSLEFDGRTLRGQYQVWNYPAHRELRVYYNGYSDAAVLTADDADLSKLAMELFGKVVRQNYMPLGRISADLPARVREAAYRYANDIEDDLPDDPDDPDYLLSHVLVESFGDQPVGSVPHQQVSWLSLNVLKAVVPAWTRLCDQPTAQTTLDRLIDCVRGGAPIDDWDDLCRPPTATRNGYRIVDCDACRVEPIADGLAHAAKYIRRGGPRLAGDVIFDAWCAQDEGAWRHETMPFSHWVVLVALPAAFDRREISDDDT